MTIRGLGRGLGATTDGASNVGGTLVKLLMVVSIPPEGGVKRDSVAIVDSDWRPREGVRG